MKRTSFTIKPRTWIAAGLIIVSCGIGVGIAIAQPAGKLWQERGSGAVPLAQVPDFSTLAAQVSPAVVSINVEQRVNAAGGRRGRGGRGGRMGQPMQDPFDFFFRQFGEEMPRENWNRGVGSGFVIHREGLILTNYHVIEGADVIEVNVLEADGSETSVPAKVLGTAPAYDVALLQAEKPLKATVAYLGDSSAMRIGDWVMAVGNPFGLSHSVSVGIISAKERRDVAPSGRQGYYNFLQTDASINPGNSGGPLINMKGEVIGINTAGSGIGFAIPIDMVKAILPELKEKGTFTRSWLGVRVQSLTADLAQTYGLSRTNGALISDVVPQSPAAVAGLHEGDVILAFDGHVLRDSSELPLYASMAGVGKRVPVKVWRQGQEKTLTVALTEFPDEQVAVGERTESSAGEGAALGLTVADITPQLARQFDLPVGAGVMVRDMEPSGLAARAGLRPGDVIAQVNGEQVVSSQGLVAMIRKISTGKILRLTVVRQGGRLFVAMRKP